ncbi:MAG: UDP-N-acetylmuramoyl-tripeptide--D-alanyl-D-alanine ligase [Propionicimonas sp.]
MDRLTAAAVAELTGARLLGDPTATVGPAVVIDSRQATGGALFVALPGEQVDGHDYVRAAAERGAAAALVAREVGTDLPQLIVPDTLAGLTELATGLVARARRDGLQVVGITGSSGKTSTKDLVAAVLRSAGPTVAPIGSFNNEVGVPLTATGVDAGTRYLVSEMGARGGGHVAALCRITPPDVGVVINVGHAHLGEFGSVAAIAQAKGELVEALAADGWAVLNAEDPNVIAMAARTRARIAGFGITGPPAAGELRVWAEQVEADRLQRHSFLLCTDGGQAPVSLRVAGGHQVGNALAAAAVGLALGAPLDLAGIAAALSAAEPASRWRMELTERADGLLVVNDAYNANPDSMAAALRSLAGLRREGGRLIALLGDMLELGATAAEAHAEVGELAGRLGVDEVLAVGEFAEAIVAGARRRGATATAVADRTAALAALADRVSPADVVLVKASRGLALESVAQQLLAEKENQA